MRTSKCCYFAVNLLDRGSVQWFLRLRNTTGTLGRRNLYHTDGDRLTFFLLVCLVKQREAVVMCRVVEVVIFICLTLGSIVDAIFPAFAVAIPRVFFSIPRLEQNSSALRQR